MLTPDPNPAERRSTAPPVAAPMTAHLPIRLMLFVLVPVLLTVGIVGLWTLRSLEAHLELRLQREVEMVARALQQPLSEALVHSGFPGTQTSLDSAVAIQRVYGAYVYDDRGKLVASSATRDPEHEDGEVRGVIARGERTGQYDEVDGQQVYSYFVPLKGAGGEIRGVLRVTRKQSNVDRYIEALRQRGLALVAVTALVLVAVVLWGYNAAVGRSLRRLAGSMHRVAGGDRSHRTDVQSPREIAALARHFNGMLDSLDSSEQRARLEQQNRRQMEQQLRQSERLATIGGLTAGVAHELGTPLSTVSGHAQRLLRRDDLAEPVRSSLGAVRAQAARMENLIKQLLDFGGKDAPKRVDAQPRRLMVSAADAVSELAEQEHVRIDVAPAEEVPIKVDRVRMEQALVNLVQNAVHAARERVELSCQRRGDDLLFVVDDDGSGVRGAVRGRLYEPFVTDKPSRGGTGLGLAIAATIAEEHGGTLDDSQSPLGGARFVLRIPRHQGARASSPSVTA